ncbi:hypothetical protein [Salipaludibacillus aurantiacus]|nr:hypothetical protein [Salipaludibacillus aurantiacus]
MIFYRLSYFHMPHYIFIVLRGQAQTPEHQALRHHPLVLLA